MKDIVIGTQVERTNTVTEEYTAKHLRSGAVDVLATPMLIAFIEETAMIALTPFLDEGENSVGTLVNISHLAATPVGMDVTCRVKITQVDRRRVVFDVEAFDECDKVCSGTHERFVINGKKFIEKCYAKRKAI